jgi:predicted dehydrogenase
MTVMALDAGKHVYVEKPASFNIDDGQAMVAARKRHSKLVVAMGTQQRSGQHFKGAKAFVDGCGLGKVALARAWMAGNRVVVKKVPDSDPPKGFDYDIWIGPAPFRPYNGEKEHYN